MTWGKGKGKKSEKDYCFDGGVRKSQPQHKARHSLFCLSVRLVRYASGELMIPWLAISAIVREYSEPGFTSVLSKLIGARRGQSAWVQLVPIPVSWTGKNYRETMERLVKFGVTPLGLYRCVDTPVRLLTSLEAEEMEPMNIIEESENPFDEESFL